MIVICQAKTFTHIFSGGTKHSLIIQTFPKVVNVQQLTVWVVLPKDEHMVKKTLQNSAALRDLCIRSSKCRAFHWISKPKTLVWLQPRTYFLSLSVIRSLGRTPSWKGHAHPGVNPSMQHGFTQAGWPLYINRAFRCRSHHRVTTTTCV